MAKPRAQTLQQRLGFEDSDLRKPDHDQIMIWLDERIEAVVRDIIGYHELGWPAEEVQRLRCIADNDVAHAKLKYESMATKARHDLEEAERDSPEHLSDYRRTNALDNLKKAVAFVEKLGAWDGLGDVHDFHHWTLTTQWEVPIMSMQYVVGFVDLVANVTKYKLLLSRLDETYTHHEKIYLPCFDVQGHSSVRLYFEAKTVISSLGELIRQLNLYRQYVSPHENSRFIVVSPDDQYVSLLKSQNVAFVRYPDGAVFA